MFEKKVGGRMVSGQSEFFCLSQFDKTPYNKSIAKQSPKDLVIGLFPKVKQSLKDILS